MRRARVLPLFAVCAAALLGVMAWLTATVRRLEQAERRGREQAALEESVRLALWRMDSLLGPFLAQESLLAPPASPHVRVRFRWDSRGRLSALRSGSRPGKESGASAPREEVDQTQARLRDMARWADRAVLLARLPAEWMSIEPAASQARSATSVASIPAPVEDTNRAPGTIDSRALALPANVDAQQRALNVREFEARAQNVAVQQAEVPKSAPVRPPTPVAGEPSRMTLLQPVWMGKELILARRVRLGREELIQGAWLDWSELKPWLIGAIRDLLPEARLEPVRDGGKDPARRLAALPLRLIPGRPAAAVPAATPGLLPPLTVAWVLAGLSVAAAGSLLWGMATLGERRAAFVSAVTHELRTPLTTLRMYAEMLSEGIVRGEQQQREYLETIRREADRQSHLVENVLSYSRLERGRYRPARETTSVGSLLSPLTGGLAAHAERTGMKFVAPEAGSWASVLVYVDRAAVERILFNLVDNACKYAQEATDRRIHLDCQVEERAVRLSVADHGPGLTARDARQLFRPFRKSARDAAQSAPGVGLGLALSRRLARAIGGDLSLEPSAGGGPRFCLSLPRA